MKLLQTNDKRIPIAQRRELQREPACVLNFANRDECVETTAGTWLALAEIFGANEHTRWRVDGMLRYVCAMLTQARCLGVPVDMRLVFRFKKAKHEMEALHWEQYKWKDSLSDQATKYKQRRDEIMQRAWGTGRFPLDDWHW